MAGNGIYLDWTEGEERKEKKGWWSRGYEKKRKGRARNRGNGQTLDFKHGYANSGLHCSAQGAFCCSRMASARDIDCSRCGVSASCYSFWLMMCITSSIYKCCIAAHTVAAAASIFNTYTRSTRRFKRWYSNSARQPNEKQ